MVQPVVSQFGRKRDPARPTSGTNAAIQIRRAKRATGDRPEAGTYPGRKNTSKLIYRIRFKNKILRDKLLQLVATVPDFGVDSAIIPPINEVFLRLRALGGTKTKSPVRTYNSRWTDAQVV